MAYLMATEQRAHDVAGGSVSYTSNLGCTKSRATTIGCSLNSPSSGYASNQLVRYDDKNKKISDTITVNYQNISISDSWRMYGAPQYTYNKTNYNIVKSSDWPVGTTANAVNLPDGVNSLTIDRSSWNTSVVIVVQGSGVNSYSAPSYISFVSSGSSDYGSGSGYVTFQRNSSSNGYIYTFYTSTEFKLFYGMTLIVRSGVG